MPKFDENKASRAYLRAAVLVKGQAGALSM